MISKAATISTVKEYMKELQKAYQATTADSWNKKVATLSPNDSVPKQGCFYDQENRDRYNAKCMELKAAALEQVQKYQDSIDTDIAQAPSEEALRALQMFSMLPPETLPNGTTYLRRINALSAKYGENALFMESLKGLAAKGGISIESHPAVRAYDDAETMKNAVSSFFENRVVFSGMLEPNSDISDASIAFMFSDFANAAMQFDAEG